MHPAWSYHAQKERSSLGVGFRHAPTGLELLSGTAIGKAPSERERVSGLLRAGGDTLDLHPIKGIVCQTFCPFILSTYRESD